MKKLSQAFVAIIVIGALNVFAQEQAPKPTYQEGDFWPRSESNCEKSRAKFASFIMRSSRR